MHYELKAGKRCSLSLEIFQGIGIIGDDCSNSLTFFQVRAVATGHYTPFDRTLTDRAETITEYRFYPVNAAAHTVDMFRQDGGMI